MSTQTRQDARRIHPTRCAACDKPLTGRYYMFRGRAEGFCADCMDLRPRCSSCGAPLEANHWQLHDGRLQCNRCHSTAVYDVNDAQGLYQETVKGVGQQLGLRLQNGVEFRLLDAPALRSLRSQDGAEHAPDEHTLGLYHRQGRLRAIYMLYGLPRLMFRITVAHEYAHAWQGEYCPQLADDDLREGFAEWVAYHHLLWLGCSRAAERMLEEPHPYRPALERVLELERQVGIPGVIEHIKRA
jgi:hypothetical protein